MANRKRKKTSVISTGSESDPHENDSVFQVLTEEGQKIMAFFEKKMKDFMDKTNEEINKKDKRIEVLEQEMVNMKKKIMLLEERIEDSEAYERRDTIIVSGNEIPAAVDGENSANIVRETIKDKIGVVIKPTDISIAHRIGKKPNNQVADKRNIIVKLCRRELKHDLLGACRRVRPPNLYINESLTPTRNTIMYGLRQAKKKFPDKIAGAGSSEGKVYVWLKPPVSSAPLARNTKMWVNTRTRFDDLCKNILKCETSNLISNWPNN